MMLTQHLRSIRIDEANGNLCSSLDGIGTGCQKSKLNLLIKRVSSAAGEILLMKSILLFILYIGYKCSSMFIPISNSLTSLI